MSDFIKGIVKLAKEYRASEKDARFTNRKASPFRYNNIPMEESNTENEKYHKYTFDCNDPVIRDAVLEELKKLSK